jgi:restriction endonuclease S subunit
MTKTKQKYQKYKESEINWVQKLPSNWENPKLKFITKCLDSERIPLNSEERSEMEGDIPYYGANGIVDYVDDYLFDEEIILLGEDGAPFHDPYEDVAFKVDEKCWVNNHAHILKAKEPVDSSFLVYALNIVKYPKLLSGSTRDKLTQSDMGDIRVVLPSKKEQQKIANYLDEKTSKIDKLIEKNNKLIELLKEKRQAVITKAVTKGIDRGASMKDSGVEWIGEIPEGWDVVKLKFLVNGSFQYGANEEASESNESDPRYVRITDINERGDLREETYKSLPIEKAKPYILEEGDILFARSGATVGKTFQYKKSWGECCFAGYLIRVRPDEKKIKSDYLYHYVNSYIYESWKDSIFIQATIQNIGADKYKNLPVVLPPKRTQKKIVEKLDQETEKIDNSIKKIKKQNQKLKEYKKTLISKVVTGKIKI